jgi:GT2 family glycosyltransferase
MSMMGVVTVTFNSGKVLDAFLDCCSMQTSTNWRLIVVDNASTDLTREILDRRLSAWMSCVKNADNRGVAEGNNQGIEAALAAGCDRVLLINNDVEFLPTLFADLDAAMTTNRSDALVPRIVYHDNPTVNWFVGGHFEWFWGPDARHDIDRYGGELETKGVRRIQYAPTCCMLVNGTVFATIGLMDKRYFVYWDDTDFCYRMHLAGLELDCDLGIIMSHKVSSLTGGVTSDFFIRYHHRNQIYYVRKHFGTPVFVYTVVMSTLKAVLRVLLRGDTVRQLRLRMRSMGEGMRIPVGN